MNASTTSAKARKYFYSYLQASASLYAMSRRSEILLGRLIIKHVGPNIEHVWNLTGVDTSGK